MVEPEECTPLRRGPVYGALYCVGGIAGGLVAWLLGGWLGALLGVLAALSFVAGVWTVLFTGFWLLLLNRSNRRVQGR